MDTLLHDSLTLPSNSDSLLKIEKIIDEICSTCGVCEDQYGNILIATTEAVNNAIYHGNKQDQNKNIHFTYEGDENEMVFVVQDQGEGFNPDTLPDPLAIENIDKPNGRGVFLMRNLADEVMFDNNGSTVSLKFIQQSI